MSSLSQFLSNNQQNWSREVWDGLIRAVEARFGPLEEQLDIERRITNQIIARGLQVIEDGIGPSITDANNLRDQIQALHDSLEVAIQIQQRGYTPTEGSVSAALNAAITLTIPTTGRERELFVPAPFAILLRDANTNDYAVVQTTSYDETTGEYKGTVVARNGAAGPFSDWKLGAIAGPAIAQINFMDTTIAKHDDVVTKHGDVVTKHGQVTTLHDDTKTRHDKINELWLGPLAIEPDPSLHAEGVRYLDTSATPPVEKIRAGTGWTAASNIQGHTRAEADDRFVSPKIAQAFSDLEKELSRKNVYAAPFDAMAYHGMQLNGLMEVSQEHGDTALSRNTATIAYAADMWNCLSVGPTTEFQRVASPFPSRPEIPHGIRAKVTTATALAASDQIRMDCVIEGYRVRRLLWGTSAAATVSLACVMRSNVPVTGYLTVTNNNKTRFFARKFTLAANTDTFVTFQIPGDIAGVWDKTNLQGLHLRFAFHAGSDNSGITPDEWGTLNNTAASDVSNIGTTAGNEVTLGSLVVLPGVELPPSDRVGLILPSFDIELPKCQRYYWKSELGTGTFIIDGYAPAAGFGMTLTVPHPVKMRAVPAAARLGTWGVSNAAQPGFDSLSMDGCRLTTSAGAAGRAFTLNSTAGSGLSMDARL